MSTREAVDQHLSWTKNRISAFPNQAVTIIEIQSGTYFGEDKIVRLEDDCGR
jgi:hypothetical protein